MSLSSPENDQETQPGIVPPETSLAEASLPPLVAVTGKEIDALWRQKVNERRDRGEISASVAKNYKGNLSNLATITERLGLNGHPDWFSFLKADLQAGLKRYFDNRIINTTSKMNQLKSTVRQFLTWAQSENFLRIENGDVDQFMLRIAPFKFRLFTLPMVERRIAEDFLGRGAAGYRLRFKDFFRFVAEELRGEDLSIYENNALELRERELKGEERLKARAEAWKAMRFPEQRQREEVVIDSVIEAICLDPECARRYAFHLTGNDRELLKGNSDLSAVRKFLDWAFERGYSAFDGDVIEALRSRPAIGSKTDVTSPRPVPAARSVEPADSRAQKEHPGVEPVESKKESGRPVLRPVRPKAKVERRSAKAEEAQKRTEQFLLLRNAALEFMLREPLCTVNRAAALVLDSQDRKSLSGKLAALHGKELEFYEGVNFICDLTGRKLKETAAGMEKIRWVGIEELAALQQQDVLVEKNAIRFAREGKADGAFTAEQTVKAVKDYLDSLFLIAPAPKTDLPPEAPFLLSSTGEPLLAAVDYSGLPGDPEVAEEMFALRERLIGLLVRDQKMSFQQICLMPLGELEDLVMEVGFGGIIRDYLDAYHRCCPSRSSRRKTVRLAFSASAALPLTNDDLSVYSNG